jgi:hypothetical protein
MEIKGSDDIWIFQNINRIKMDDHFLAFAFITKGVRRVTVCHESSFMHQLLMHENVLCYRKDEDWPLEIIVQEMVSNHP